jgi:hypothetical protein
MDLRKKDKSKERNPDIVRSARFLETEDGWFFRTRPFKRHGPQRQPAETSRSEGYSPQISSWRSDQESAPRLAENQPDQDVTKSVEV